MACNCPHTYSLLPTKLGYMSLCTPLIIPTLSLISFPFFFCDSLSPSVLGTDSTFSLMVSKLPEVPCSPCLLSYSPLASSFDLLLTCYCFDSFLLLIPSLCGPCLPCQLDFKLPVKGAMNSLSLTRCRVLGRHLIESVSFGGNPVTYGKKFVCIHILLKYTLIIFPVGLVSFPGERRGRCSSVRTHLSPRDARGHTNLVRPIRPINPAEEISIHPPWVSSPIISSDLGCF